MKKVILNLFIIFLFLTLVTSLYAETNFGRGIRNTIRETIEEGKEATVSPKQIREEIRQEIREEIKEKNQDLIDKVKNMIKKNLKLKARETGTIVSIGENSFVINTKDGKTLTINITSETKLIRRFGGKSDFSEFSVGNEINVFGKYTDETQMILNAFLIRNISIQKRWGVFFGEITVKNSDNFVTKTIERGNQIVYFGLAKFLNHKKEVINYNDVQIGNRVRVKGMWDRSTNKITEVEEIRVFPQKPSITPKP